MKGEVRKEFIRELLERIDIVEVISEYVSLKKVGKDWYGICPFHPDTKPSMRVREDKKVFNCFGCHVGGNVITFISKIKNISFHEALTFLAERYYPDITVEINREYFTEKRKIVQANAHILFNLRKFFKNKEGKQAREYLRTRKISEEMWDKFGLGYAPDDPALIPSLLLKEGFDEDTLTKTGSIKKIGDNLHFIFRKKLMFPISNTKGEVIAFGGRTLDDNISPKYINSAESTVFRKRESFFGIEQSIDEIRLYGRCAIAEGYFDVISLHQADIKYTLSCLGTAITTSHIGFIKKIATDIIFMFDGDDAGRRAVLRNIVPFLKSGVIPKVCVFPAGEDPDSFIRKGGDVQELEVKDGLIFVAEYLLQKAKEHKDPVLLSRAISEIQELISIIYHESQAQAEIYIREISEKTGISAQSLRADIRRLSKPVSLHRRERKDIPEYELEILRFALAKKEALKYIKSFVEHIQSDDVKRALRCVEEAEGNPELAISLAEGDIKNLMLSLIIEGKEYPEVGWEELLESTLKRAAVESIRRELGELAKQAKEDPMKKQRYMMLLRKLAVLEGVKAKAKKKSRF